MKQIFKLLSLAFFVTLMSCHNRVKPSPEQMKQEKLTLVKVIKASKNAYDVFGDTLKTYSQYYIYSKASANLISISGMKEGGNMTVNNYLTGMGLLGKEGSDTVTLVVGMPRETITVRQFRLKDIRLSSGKLY